MPVGDCIGGRMAGNTDGQQEINLPVTCRTGYIWNGRARTRESGRGINVLARQRSGKKKYFLELATFAGFPCYIDTVQ